MKLLGWLLAAAVALAVLRAAAAALVAGFALALIVALWTEPQAVLGFTALCVIAGLIHSHPLAFMGLMALMTVAGMVRHRGA